MTSEERCDFGVEVTRTFETAGEMYATETPGGSIGWSPRCTLSPHHPTRKAIFEFDKLVRSMYTLRYLRDPQLQRNVHRSQNRIESYHQLRVFIAESTFAIGLPHSLLDATSRSVLAVRCFFCHRALHVVEPARYRREG